MSVRASAVRPRFELRSLLLAMLALVLAVAGPPTVLLLLVGNPLDVPTGLRSAQVLTSPIDEHSVLWLVAAVVWLLWLHLLGSLAVELARQVRGSTLRMPVPGLLFGANSLLAGHLIAMLVLGLHPSLSNSPGILTPAVVRSAAFTHPISAAAAANEVAPRMLAAAPDSSTVVRGGAGQRTAGTGPAAVECRVLPPNGRRHDTLWDIAERHLADGTRWREIFALNQGRVMPDGQHMSTASLIYPGWVLRLPADATSLPLDQVVPPAAGTGGRGLTTRRADPPTRDAPALRRAEPNGVRRPVRSSSAAPITGGQNGVPAATTAAGALPVRTAPAAAPRSAPAAAPPAAAGPDTNVGARDSVAVAGLGVAALALLGGLTRRRKVAARRRPTGTRPATAAVELIAIEAGLRRDARAAADVAAVVRLAMLLAANNRTGPARPPATLKAVWHHPDGSLELVLAQPPPTSNSPITIGAAGPASPDPAGWAPAGTADVRYPFQATHRGWLLPADAHKYLFATSTTLGCSATGAERIAERVEHELQDAVDPFPLLLPVGSQDGSACYVNLEAFGVVSLLPPTQPNPAAPERPADEASTGTSALLVTTVQVLGALVHALAGAPWSELLRVAVPPAMAELAVGLERIEVLHPELLSRLLALVAEPVQDVVQETGSMVAGRCADPDGIGIIGTVVVAGLAPDQAPEALLAAATRPTVPLVMLLLGSHPAAHQWQLSSDDTLSIPGIADRLSPLRLDPTRQQLLLRLLGHAQDPPQAADADRGRQVRADDCPAQQSPMTTPPARAAAASPAQVPAPTVVSPTRLEPDRVTSAHGQQREAPTTAGRLAATEADLASVAETAAEGEVAVRPEVAAGDEASATETTPEPPPEPGPEPAPMQAVLKQIEVGVLGPLLIDGVRGSIPRTQVRELLVYLALHRRPVAPERLWEAIWPDRPFNGHTVRNRMSDLKALLRQQVRNDTGGYSLPETVSCDWQRFQSLAQGGVDQQLEALNLVRGRPFEDQNQDWFHLEGQHAAIEAAIVDLALQVGNQALEDGDLSIASVAAAAGLRGCPYEDRLYQLAMRAAAGRGATGHLRALRRQLQRALDDELEPEGSMLPGTAQLYQELLDTDRARHT